MLNPEYAFPKDQREVLEMVTPEAAMLYEAMQVGARHLHDAGYSKTAEGKEDEDGGEDTSPLDIEQQLAVWSTTNNYKKAESQKAWVAVHGEGDPTGRGEGFSFLRSSMKDYFLRKGETEQGRRSKGFVHIFSPADCLQLKQRPKLKAILSRSPTPNRIGFTRKKSAKSGTFNGQRSAIPIHQT